MSKEDIVRVEHVGMKYQSVNGEIDAIQDVSFTVKKGEFVGIVGPSGCGKSTLLSIISGLLRPSQGKVFINDEEVVKTSEK